MHRLEGKNSEIRHTGKQITPILGILNNFAVLIKARSLHASVFTISAVVGLVIGSGGSLSIYHLLAPLAAFFLSLALYTLNDISDRKLDAITSPKRPIVSRIPLKTAYGFVTLSNLIGITAGFMINFNAFIVAILATILGIMYSAPKIALKDRFVFKTLAIAVGLFLSTIFGIVTAGHLDATAIYVAGAIAAFAFMSSPINDIADQVGDRMKGRRTIPIVLGSQSTISLAQYMTLFIIALSWFAYYYLHVSLITPLLVTGICAATIVALKPLRNRTDDLSYIENKHRSLVPLHFILQLALVTVIL
ncbi:MAG: UbiA prenyltransferase family protein [Nitrososphaerales archaeon]